MIEGTVFHTGVPSEISEAIPRANRCPDCGAGLVHRDACLACVACGFSRCG